MALDPRIAPDIGVQRQRFEQEKRLPTQEVVVHNPGDTTIGTGPTTVMTAPDDRFFLIEGVSVTNVTGGAESFSVYIVPAGGTASTANAVIHQEQVAGYTSLRLVTLEGLILDAGASLQVATTSPGGINVTLWGVNIRGI